MHLVNMQTKNTMEFTNKQSELLQQLKDVVKLRNLLLRCEKFKTELENIIFERNECLAGSEKSIQLLNSLQEELKLTITEEFYWQQKLEKVKISFVDHKNDHLHNMCLLLGFQISNCQVLDNRILAIKLCYREICYVTYCETVQGSYDVLEIYPPHLNFLQIQQYLRESQDLRGLLTYLRKFFDYALEFKEKYIQK